MSNTSDFDIDEDTVWHAIDPINRDNKENPVLIDVGDLEEKEFGDTETIIPSYNPQGVTTSGLRNPSVQFHLVGLDEDGDFVDETKTATINRYMLLNSNERILNYQFKCPKYSNILDDETEGQNYFLMDLSSLVVFRNVGEQGLSTTDTSGRVRGIQRGWGFSDPYYYCVVNIDNVNGLYLDVGNE